MTLGNNVEEIIFPYKATIKNYGDWIEFSKGLDLHIFGNMSNVKEFIVLMDRVLQPIFQQAQFRDGFHG